MGSDETASTIPGGPRVIDVFDTERGAIGSKLHFFRGQRPSPRLGVGLVVGKRLHRIRRRCGSLVSHVGEPPLEAIGAGAGLGNLLFLRLRAAEAEIGQKCLKRRRLRRRRLRVYSTDPRRPQGDAFRRD